MIASEEVEPGIGWYYTGWLNELSHNTSIKTVDLGKKLIDDYITEVRAKTPKSQATLSLVDLAELSSTIPKQFSEFSQSTGTLIEAGENYKRVSDSRAGTKEFASSSGINQIDQLVDIILSFDQDNPYGEVLGARIVYDNETETSNLPKGLIDINPGDRIDYLCDYYGYQGEFDDTYYLGEPYYATGEWHVENLSISNLKFMMSYMLTDIYGNSYWTPVITD